jgi:hypothetical protein
VPVGTFQRQLQQILGRRPVRPGQQQRGPEQAWRAALHELLEGHARLPVLAEPSTHLTPWHPSRLGHNLVRTVACPVPPEARPRLRGARPGTAQPPRLPAPLVVTRRVSVRGAIMVGGQRIQVGLAHARKTVAVTVGPDTIQVAVEPGITVTAARTTSRDIRRHKASNYG